MKELLFCYKKDKKLFVRYSTLTDVFIPIQDVISPQKTTLTIPKTSVVELSDIVVIRDNNSNVVEYIGYVDTLTNKTNTEISCYPLINVFDNDYVLDQMFEKGKNQDETEVDVEIEVVDWLTKQLKRAFIDTEDNLQALPLIITNHTKQPVFYKKIVDTANLFEVYVDLFINTGVYIVFSGLQYNKNEITGIYCDIYCNTNEKPYYLRYDNPSVQNVDIVDNTFTNYNKLIVTEELAEGSTKEPQRYYFYLLNDNNITTNPNDSRRIKQVRSKEITVGVEINTEQETKVKNEAKTKFENEGFTGEELNKKIEEAVLEYRAKPFVLRAYNELQAPEYNLQITIDMFKDDNIKLYRRVDFVSDKTYNDNGITKNVIYSSNVTKIEILNDKQIRITLGALRNSLTDFKKKVEAI